MNENKFCGNVDRYADGKIFGWAFDNCQPNRCVEVNIFADDKFVESISADQYRPDLEKAGYGDGKIGFVYALTNSDLQGDTISIRIKATGEQLHNCPFDLEPVRAHRDKLRELLAVSPVNVQGMMFDGMDLSLDGYAISRGGNPDDFEFYFDGIQLSNISYPNISRKIGRHYWFLPNSNFSGFTAKISLNEYKVTKAPYYRFWIKDKTSTRQSFNGIVIPKTFEKYQNLPDKNRMNRVQSYMNNERFTNIGLTHALFLLEIANVYTDRQLCDTDHVLDWGCGCGRVLRHFSWLPEKPPRITGIDIDADNIEWCKNNLDKSDFFHVPLLPPTSLPDNQFDLIYGISVFTHLKEQTHFLWLEEIRRILRPRGLAIVTVAGDSNVAHIRLPLNMIKNWQERGYDDVGKNFDIDGQINDQEYYRNTRITKRYIREKWSKYLKVIDIIDGAFGVQDAVVLQKN